MKGKEEALSHESMEAAEQVGEIMIAYASKDINRYLHAVRSLIDVCGSALDAVNMLVEMNIAWLQDAYGQDWLNKLQLVIARIRFDMDKQTTEEDTD